ncbi:MAG: hypothetical protein PW735_02275 [Acidobacteriaceae bacterium]|nr:hypothetical protein [Acidobacteriaceae bacterium]
MFVEDQRDRGVPLADDGVSSLPKDQAEKYEQQQQDWNVVARHDADHLKRVHVLLSEGKVVTAQDFHDASFLLQHSSEPSDYLLAHILAIRAVGLGDTGSQWIAAATLDRYLQSIGRGQVFGSQYLTEQYSFYLMHHNEKDFTEASKKVTSQATTQQPYEETVLPDVLRKAFCIPDLAVQKAAVEKGNATGNMELPTLEHCNAH